MVELCSTQHFGGTNENMTQSACTGFHGNTGVILPVDWVRLSAPWLWLKRIDQNSDRTPSLSPPLFKPITASASLIGGTLWRRPREGWEGLLVGTSPCLVCSHSALDLTNKKRGKNFYLTFQMNNIWIYYSELFNEGRRSRCRFEYFIRLKTGLEEIFKLPRCCLKALSTFVTGCILGIR